MAARSWISFHYNPLHPILIIPPLPTATMLLSCSIYQLLNRAEDACQWAEGCRAVHVTGQLMSSRLPESVISSFTNCFCISNVVDGVITLKDQ
jgi:hypothetical protein